MTGKPIVGSVITGVGLILALAATVGPPPPSSPAAGASVVIRLPDAVKATVLGLLGISVLIILTIQRLPRHREDEPERKSQRLPPWAGAVASLSAALTLAALWYVIRERWTGADGQVNGGPFAAITNLLEALASARKPPMSVPFFETAVAVVAVLVAVAVLFFVLLVALSERISMLRAARAGNPVAPAVHEAVLESLDELRSEPDARRAILRVYRLFEHALFTARAPRAPWQTPAEFMRAALARLPVPPTAIERLTGLFELARFSDRVLGADARDAACDCLDEIKTALEQDAAHAV